ncbi:hypothetical protein HNR02_002379 [Amycolatopsis endophytica]|uniref:Uncharacterized protein n=1 Tax=Amycolatopsis endophytica TaxID=860233 RepID=A0A853B346_9PSEU|nr:hypothetical protein [Amycolatopsis endophytica]
MIVAVRGLAAQHGPVAVSSFEVPAADREAACAPRATAR